MSDPGSWNRYAYVQNDPVNFDDFSGFQRKDVSEPKEGGPDCDPDINHRGSPDSCYPGYPTSPPRKGPGGTGGGGNPADCRNNFSAQQGNFVEQNYTSAALLSAKSGVLVENILGWAALETGWGTNTASTVNQNFFSWGGKGNAACPDNADPRWGCFTSFFNSGLTALFSTQNYFNYGGSTGVSAASILMDQFTKGATVTQAFDALATAGYTPDKGYGAGVASRANQILNVEICLTSLHI